MNIDFATGFAWFASFLFSTTVHEAMHALAAWRLGDPTAYNGGQVTLSPFRTSRENLSACCLCRWSRR
jgi:Zn-dependent protease